MYDLAADQRALLFACAALVFNGVFDLVYGMAHRQKLDESTYIVIQSGVVLTTLGLFSALFAGWSITPGAALLGMATGLVGLATGWTHLYAMGRGPASVTSAVRRVGFVVTALLAVTFLDETLSARKLAAMGLAIVALVTIFKSPNENQRPHPAAYITILTSGLMAFGHKLGAIAGVSLTTFLMFQSGTAHLAAHALCLRRGGYRINARTVRFAAVSGSLIAVNMSLAMAALRDGEAVVIAPLLQLGFLVTAPLSFIFLREPITRRKVVGLCVGACAILLFAGALGPSE